MTTPTFHIAQYNIARLIHPIDHPQTAEFVTQLDEVNALADQAPALSGGSNQSPAMQPIL